MRNPRRKSSVIVAALFAAWTSGGFLEGIQFLRGLGWFIGVGAEWMFNRFLECY
jgi:hypothetical protein